MGNGHNATVTVPWSLLRWSASCRDSPVKSYQLVDLQFTSVTPLESIMICDVYEHTLRYIILIDFNNVKIGRNSSVVQIEVRYKI